MKTYMTAFLLVATAMAQPVSVVQNRDVQAGGSNHLEDRAGSQLLNLQVGGKKDPTEKPAIIDINALTQLLGVGRK